MHGGLNPPCRPDQAAVRRSLRRRDRERLGGAVAAGGKESRTADDKNLHVPLPQMATISRKPARRRQKAAGLSARRGRRGAEWGSAPSTLQCR